MIIIFENDKDDDDDDPVRWQPGHNGSPYPAPPTPAQCLLCEIKTIPLCICARCTVYTNHCKLYLYVYLCICGRSTPTTVSCTSPTVRYAALSSSPLHWVTLHIRLCLQDQHRPGKHMVSDTRPRPMYFTAASCSSKAAHVVGWSTCSWQQQQQQQGSCAGQKSAGSAFGVATSGGLDLRAFSYIPANVLLSCRVLDATYNPGIIVEWTKADCFCTSFDSVALHLGPALYSCCTLYSVLLLQRGLDFKSADYSLSFSSWES